MAVPSKYMGGSAGRVYREIELPELFAFHFQQFLAGPHQNFHYVIGDPDSKEAALVDPAFHVPRLVEEVTARGYSVRDAFFTHGHWDHIGGIPEIMDHGVDRVYVHETARSHPKVEEALAAGAEVGLAADGDVVLVGGVPVQWLHTPGHQPEASCLLVGHGPSALVGGDTLFIGSCGRTDFPGGDTDAMFASMARLRALASTDVHVMPGHHYGDVTTRNLEDEVPRNPALSTIDRAAFGKLAFLRD